MVLVYDALRGYYMDISVFSGVISTPETAALVTDYIQSGSDFRAAVMVALGLMVGLLLAHSLR